jgi:hypothetical protein
VISKDHCYQNNFDDGLSGELVLTGVAVSGTYTCFNKNKQRDVIHLQELYKSFRVATFSGERYSIKKLHNGFQLSGEYVSMNSMCQRYSCMLQLEMRLATITLFWLSKLLAREVSLTTV